MEQLGIRLLNRRLTIQKRLASGSTAVRCRSCGVTSSLRAQAFYDESINLMRQPTFKQNNESTIQWLSTLLVRDYTKTLGPRTKYAPVCVVQ